MSDNRNYCASQNNAVYRRNENSLLTLLLAELTDVKQSFSSPLNRLRCAATVAVESLESRRHLHAAHQGIFINPGGAAYTDSNGHAWLADTYATGGETKIAGYDVTGTTDDAIYASRRFGANFVYNIPVTAGTYHVTLNFSEPWFTTRGSRVFNVAAEGVARLSNFDILSVAAPKAAASQSFQVFVGDTNLNLTFAGVVENALVSGIAIERVAVVPPKPVAVSASAISSSQIDISWRDGSVEETGFAIERSTDGVSFTQVAVVAGNSTKYSNTGLNPGTTYFYRVVATSAAGRSAPSAVVNAKTAAGGQTPFGGTPIRLPATIEAENFDNGGSAIAFNDATPANAGGMYRETPVDIFSIASNTVFNGTSLPKFGIGSIRAGEWLEYTIEVPATASYSAQLRFASGSQGGAASIQIDGTPWSSAVTLPNTLGWSKFSNIAIPAKTIAAGKHIVRVTFDRAARSGEEIGVLDSISFLTTGGQQPLPAAPLNFAARGVGDTQVNLSWDDAAGNEANYLVQRKLKSESDFVTIATLPANTEWYVDGTVKALTDYAYRVVASNVGGGAPSGEVTLGTWKSDVFRWKVGADNPAARYEAAGAAVNGKLYVFGGYINEQIQATARVDVYNPASDKWTQLNDMPEVVTHAGQAVDGNFIYIAGGFVGNHPGLGSRRVWRYDTINDRWDAMPPLPQPRGGGALARVGSALHYFGGLTRAQTATINQAQHWVLDLSNIHLGWNSRAALPNARNHLSTAELNGKIYAIGGQDLWNELTGAKANVDVFDPATNTWSAAAPLPVARSHTSASTFSLNGKIYVVGGATNDFKTMRDVTVYDPTANSWTNMRSLSTARLTPVAGAIGKMLIVTTGSAYGLKPEAGTFFGLLD